MKPSRVSDLALASGLLVVVVSFLACDTPSSAPQPEVEGVAQALTAEPADVAANRKVQDRADALKKVDDLKKRLGALPGHDSTERRALLKELREAHDRAHSLTPGAGGPLPGATGFKHAPISPERYASLRSKMAAYDMSKPADVAAWAALKKKELGQ